MINFQRLTQTNFSLVESVKTYKDMAFALFVPIMQTALLSTVFIMCGQALLSLLPQSPMINICFWIWVGFVFSLSTASFFKTSEDIVLNKAAQIYANIAHVLVLSAKLFAVICLIFGTLALLIAPMFFIKNPLFSLPYKVLASIFIIGAIPFVYFAPLAVALREANIFNSFTFSYYMVLQRWGRISQSIIAQIVFTTIIAFWAYFIVSLLFFPNSSDFFDFLLTKASALSDQARNLYIRFVFWEVIQIFVFTLISAIFIGINTILFLYFEGSISKLLQENDNVKVNPLASKNNSEVKFVDVLEKSSPISIDTKAEEEETHHKTRREVLSEIYPGYTEEKPTPKPKAVPKKVNMQVLEDNYPKQ